MLDSALDFTRYILNRYLQQTVGTTNEVVIMNNIINPAGDVPAINKNRIILSLLNIEQETNKRFYGRNQQTNTGNYVDVNPFERYNLDLLFASSFQDYKETLKFLNGTLRFFQVNSSVSRDKFSNMPKGLNRMDFDIEKIGYHQMHSLWSAMGAKYQPSVIYKLRLIEIQGEETIKVTPAVSSTDNQSVLQ